MVLRSRSSTRHCPLCGLAMQASKSQETLRDFDTFSCLGCDTTIIESKPRPRPEGGGKN